MPLRRTLLVFVAVVVMTAAAGCSGGRVEAALKGYRVSADGLTVTLLVDIGPTDTDLRGEILKETDASITVHATVSRPGGDQPAMAVPADVSMTLGDARRPAGGQVGRGSGRVRALPNLDAAWHTGSD